MASDDPGLLKSPATRVVVRVVIYYAILIALGAVARGYLPGAAPLSGESLSDLFNGNKSAVLKDGLTVSDGDRSLSVIAAMVAAILLSLPVAWVYQLTRAKRGYQQSVVQILVILPLVVAGIVVLVKYSLALSFSLAGIVAAVRFRNTLDDSKDAVYVFLATGIGLSSAVDIPVATALSLLFNTTVLALWYSDFGNAPVELEGTIAARRLNRAKELAKTGTFVAQIDNEVFKNMSREQLEGIAQRALRRAHDDEPKSDGIPQMERCLRVTTSDIDATRRAFEAVIDQYVKRWRAGEPVFDDDGNNTIDYFIQPKKKVSLDDLVELVKNVGGANVIEAEIR